MFKVVSLLAFTGGASAFTAPKAARTARVVLNAETDTPASSKIDPTAVGGAVTNLVGTPTTLSGGLKDLDDVAQKQGIPNFIYDPLNLAQAEYFGEDNAATIGFIRQAELKHGRIAMAGFVGFLVHAQGLTWPFPMTMDGAKWPTLQEAGSVPALWDLIPEGGKWQIILTIGLLEWWDEYQFEPEKNPSKPKHYMRGGRPGDYPPFFGEDKNFLPLNLYDPFGAFKKMTPEQAEKRRIIEINNGRLAMIGLFSLLASSKLDGSVPLLTGVLPTYTGKVMAPFEANFHLF